MGAWKEEGRRVGGLEEEVYYPGGEAGVTRRQGMLEWWVMELVAEGGCWRVGVRER